MKSYSIVLWKYNFGFNCTGLVNAKCEFSLVQERKPMSIRGYTGTRACS